MSSHFFRAFALAVAIAAVLSVTALTRADVDLWGHLRFGLDILDSGTLESTDTYSFTSDRSWINHEWLSEVAIAGAWLAGGASGLILLKLVCILGALGFIGAALEEKGITGRARIMLLGLTLAGLLMRVTHVRPQLFSVLLFAALIYIFVRSERGSNRTLLWTIPILVLWANFHGGWLVGVGTVGLWCAGGGRWESEMGEGDREMGMGNRRSDESADFRFPISDRRLPKPIADSHRGCCGRRDAHQPVRRGAVGFLDRDGQVRS